MGMKKSRDVRRPALRRETVRRLDAVSLADADLARVHGGALGTREQKAPTCPCRTSCD